LADNNSIKLGLVLFKLKNNIYLLLQKVASCISQAQAVLATLDLKTAFIAWAKSIISIIIP